MMPSSVRGFPSASRVMVGPAARAGISSVSLARPKSRILTRPSAVTMTFVGLGWRWTVAEGRGGLGLLDEAALALGVGDLVGRQDLDGDGPVEMGIDGLVDGTHAALADLLDDPVMQERKDEHNEEEGARSLF